MRRVVSGILTQESPRVIVHPSMPPQAAIIIFEDDMDHVDTVREILERDGHTVVGAATTMEALMSLLATDEAKTATVALIDNQAPWHAGEAPDNKGVGAIAERHIREALGERIITIAFTTTERPAYGDYQFSLRRTFELPKFITSLPSKER